jgi:hypothetical protein
MTAEFGSDGRAIALMPSAFGRVAQALTTSPKGELWLDLTALRAHLSESSELQKCSSPPDLLIYALQWTSAAFRSFGLLGGLCPNIRLVST